MNIAPWILALRLRTLPLATATIALGVLIAYPVCGVDFTVALMTWGTAVALQMLSNIANDYGDHVHGADHVLREGPKRAVQSGLISSTTMYRAIWILAALCLVMGTTLVLLAFDEWLGRGVFFVLGIISIWAAINYTAGSKPYGYRGLGDVAVMIFFGWVAVAGSYYLQCKSLSLSIGLPAIAAGCLSIAVLNVNNIRDIVSDRQAGKRSVPVQIGRQAAVKYHLILLTIAVVSAILFSIASYKSPVQFVFLIALPLLVKNYRAVASIEDSIGLDPFLKQMALSATLFLLLWGVAYVLSQQ